jgi:hypothetical protein
LEEEEDSKENLPNFIFPLSLPFSHPCARRDTKQRSWRKFEEEPRIRIHGVVAGLDIYKLIHLN